LCFEMLVKDLFYWTCFKELMDRIIFGGARLTDAV
jgi:hypothetical protein